MLVNNFLENSASKNPDKTALICGDKRLTYAEIDAMAGSLASVLLSEGVEKGDRVAVFLDNSIEAVVAVFAILKTGATFLMVNQTTKQDKLNYMLNNCRASALISHIDKFNIASEAYKTTPSLKFAVLSGKKKDIVNGSQRYIFMEDALTNMSSSWKPVVTSPCIDVDLATIIYTSGSTGNPKGVMMTHHNMVSAANSITQYLENREDDIILNLLPLSFDYGLYQVLMGFKMGATLVLEKSFIYPYKVIETILKEKVTGFPIVPTISAILLQMEELKNHNFEHLRYISNTAAALPPIHITKLREIFPKARIYSMYGLTECKRVTYLPPDQIDIRPTSVGKGMPNEDVYIVDEDGKRVGPNIVGELVVRGSNVMKGYWEMPEETAKRLKPGRYPGEMVLYTGDLFKMDEEGYLYFVARKDDIIKSRGEKVSPKEIENILYEIDGVVEAAVIGVPDDILGQAIKAFIVLKNGATMTEKDVQRFCSKKLEDFMVPKYVEFRFELPKTSTGKISKKMLTETRLI